MLSGSEASKRAPNHTPAKLPNTLPQQSRSASVRREFRFFAALRMTRVRQGLSDPAAPSCVSCWHDSEAGYVVTLALFGEQHPCPCT